jgi:hypothetical protein
MEEGLLEDPLEPGGGLAAAAQKSDILKHLLSSQEQVFQQHHSPSKTLFTVMAEYSTRMASRK